MKVDRKRLIEAFLFLITGSLAMAFLAFGMISPPVSVSTIPHSIWPWSGILYQYEMMAAGHYIEAYLMLTLWGIFGPLISFIIVNPDLSPSERDKSLLDDPLRRYELEQEGKL